MTAISTALHKALTCGVHLARVELTAQTLKGQPPTAALRPLNDELDEIDTWAKKYDNDAR